MSKISASTEGLKRRPAYPTIGLFVDGQWVFDREPAFEVRNPSDETTLGLGSSVKGE